MHFFRKKKLNNFGKIFKFWPSQLVLGQNFFYNFIDITLTFCWVIRVDLFKLTNFDISCRQCLWCTLFDKVHHTPWISTIYEVWHKIISVEGDAREFSLDVSLTSQSSFFSCSHGVGTPSLSRMVIIVLRCLCDSNSPIQPPRRRHHCVTTIFGASLLLVNARLGALLANQWSKKNYR